MDIAIEMFTLNGKLREMRFFQYKLTGKGDVKNFFKISGSARYALLQRNNYKAVFSKQENFYSIEKLENIPEVDGCIIQPLDWITLPVQGFENIYADLLIRYINENLKKNKKYNIKFNNKITSLDILNRDNSYEKIKSLQGINLERVFYLDPVVKSDGQVFLGVSVNSKFTTDKNIYDMMQENKNVSGIDVNYLWSTIDGAGKITEILDKKISDKLDCLKGQSLIEFFCNTNQEYRVNKFTDKDKEANVVMVCYKGQKTSRPHIPQSLKPVLDREYVSRTDPSFSIKTDKFVKMEMDYRFKILSAFIKDIGKLNKIDDLEFNFNSCKCINEFGFEVKELVTPTLVGAKGQKTTRNGIFKTGYYKKPDKKINVGIMYPEDFEKQSRKALGNIWTFNVHGYVKDSKGIKHKTSCENLMDLEYERLEFSAYKSGDITDYKKVAYSLKNNQDLNLILCVIPDEEEDNPYSPFKEVMAELSIPSQMITTDSIDKINDCDDIDNIYSYSGLYYIQNISLGMLGKTGGIPWVSGNMDSNVDCFIGLDVGNPDKKKIRYPACSIMFDKSGSLIGYFRPKLPQTGEKIVDEILQDIFDRVLLSYNEKYSAYPKHVVIHRDGFARENIDWFKTYFGNKDIIFDIVEIKKDGAIKFGEIYQDYILNPLPGIYLTDGDVAYLVTTDIPPNKKNNKNKKRFLGSSNPLKIEKVYGNSSLDELVKQIYYLSEIHIGSIKSTRLPVTTGYADRISKSVRFIPEGKLDNRLFFL